MKQDQQPLGQSFKDSLDLDQLEKIVKPLYRVDRVGSELALYGKNAAEGVTGKFVEDYLRHYYPETKISIREVSGKTYISLK